MFTCVSTRIRSHATSAHQICPQQSTLWQKCTDAHILVSSQSEKRKLLAQNNMLHVSSFAEFIEQDLSFAPQAQQCLWIQNSHVPTKKMTPTEQFSSRHPQANSRGEWYRNVWIDKNRSFGVEIEITSADFESTKEWKYKKWKKRAELIRCMLVHTLGVEHVSSNICYTSQPSYDKWQVVYDQSAGWEIISPILYGTDGLKEISSVVHALRDVSHHGMYVSHNTGLHVHLGWDESLSSLKRLLHWWFFFEPSLATLVHPQRISAFHGGYFAKTYNNGHCIPICQSIDGETIQKATSFAELYRELPRNSSLNIQSLKTTKSIEIRMLESTLDPQLVCFWISLCQQIAYVASRKSFAIPVPKHWESIILQPSGDALTLFNAYLPAGNVEKFRQQVRMRRRQIATRWCRNATLHQWLSFVERWTI